MLLHHGIGGAARTSSPSNLYLFLAVTGGFSRSHKHPAPAHTFNQDPSSHGLSNRHAIESDS
jgi:hypothetical protein